MKISETVEEGQGCFRACFEELDVDVKIYPVEVLIGPRAHVEVDRLSPLEGYGCEGAAENARGVVVRSDESGEDNEPRPSKLAFEGPARSQLAIGTDGLDLVTVDNDRGVSDHGGGH